MKRFSKTLLLMLLVLPILLRAQDNQKIILDADTGNEVDDLYAIVRCLVHPGWEVTGLNATQWQVSHWAVENTMEDSYRLNQVLLSYLKMNDRVASNRGSETRLYDWGNKSNPSAASNFIIREAKKTGDEKLDVIVLGALTNVASALLDDPSITDRIRVHWLGINYDFEAGLLKATSFNSVMDIQAVDVVFNSRVELHIMPHSVAREMVFSWEETQSRFAGEHDLLDFLLDRWYNHMDGGRRERVLWDLALIEAMIHPEFAEKQRVRTPPAFGNRDVWIYSDIDEAKMKSDFLEKTLEAVRKLD